MFSKRFLIVASAVAFALPALFSTAARAQSQSKLQEQWETLAGSNANAKSLITGLRDGSQVTLTSGTTTTTFTPPTGKMGNGSVNNALLLAQESLKQQNITNPTSDQLKTALMGVLDQRASHKGWGEIANSMGVKLGDLRRNERADLVAKDKDRRPERAERAEKPEKPERPERPERPDHAARGGR